MKFEIFTLEATPQLALKTAIDGFFKAIKAKKESLVSAILGENVDDIDRMGTRVQTKIDGDVRVIHLDAVPVATYTMPKTEMRVKAENGYTKLAIIYDFTELPLQRAR